MSQTKLSVFFSPTKEKVKDVPKDESTEELLWDIPAEPELTPDSKKRKVITCVKRRSLTPMKVINEEKQEQEETAENENPNQMEKKKQAKLEQVCIDAGQKNFFQTRCPQCAMYYVPGDSSEEKLHNEYHKKTLENEKAPTPSFSSFQSSAILKEFSDGSKIICVLETDDDKYQKKANKIIAIVDNELGYSEPDDCFKSKETKLFYVNSQKKVLGCAVAEIITSAHPLVESKKADNSSVNSPAKRSITNEQKVSYAISKTSKEASCGISRLWVHANFRGKKIGTRLMEAVRGGMIYGFTIPKDQVAVTYLGDQGRKFFVKYFGTETYLVYIVNK